MKTKLGYCSACHQNKEHTRTAGLASGLNLFSIGILGLFGISTWSCNHCRRHSSFLRVVWNRQPAEVKKVKAGRVVRPPNGGLKKVENNSMTDGEDIKASSAKTPVKQTKLYSEKFRDDIVRRILTGKATMRSACDSLNVDEPTIMEWIRSNFIRTQERIKELESELKELQSNSFGARLQSNPASTAERPTPSITSHLID